MKVTDIEIIKFRGFNNIKFSLGRQITIFAGQNGTQKTTLLGLLTQPFAITDKENPIINEKPLCGGNYRSAFSEKFKLSQSFDLPKNHEWTLFLDSKEIPYFTLESILRDKTSSKIRFWKKGDRSKGAGYLPLPVIYLSLSRLTPIGEDSNITENKEFVLTDSEKDFYQKWHNKILIIPDININDIPLLKSNVKNTAGVNTDFYDWKMNSAGQDNLGKILLAIISFKRLKEKYPQHYNGGILAIDELDATLYPASQIKLLEALQHFATRYDIQIFFTTHSLSLLKESLNLKNPNLKTIFLERKDRKIVVREDFTFDYVKNKLNVTLNPSTKQNKVPLFTEDHEAYLFLKGIMQSKFSLFSYNKCSLGCGELLNLTKKKVYGFREKDSIIVLDGDIKNDSSKMKNIKNFKNVLLLPGKESPELLLAEYLYEKNDSDKIWEELCNEYTKQVAFKDYQINEIKNGNGNKKSRDISKEWFKQQLQYWGKDGSKLIKLWAKENESEVKEFVETILDVYNKIV